MGASGRYAIISATCPTPAAVDLRGCPIRKPPKLLPGVPSSDSENFRRDVKFRPMGMKLGSPKTRVARGDSRAARKRQSWIDIRRAEAPVPELRSRQGDLGPGVLVDQLSQVRAMDGPAHRHRARVDALPHDPRARHLAALETRRVPAGRRDGAVSNRHHACTIVSGVHVRPAAGGDPDRRRATNATNHRHYPAAQQRRPLQRRPVRLHAGVRRRCAQPAGRGGAPAGRNGHRDYWELHASPTSSS